MTEFVSVSGIGPDVVCASERADEIWHRRVPLELDSDERGFGAAVTVEGVTALVGASDSGPIRTVHAYESAFARSLLEDGTQRPAWFSNWSHWTVWISTNRTHL